MEAEQLDYGESIVGRRENVSQIIDMETGEIQGKLYPGDYIVRKKQHEYYEKNKKEIESEKIYDFGQSNNFTMLNQYAAKQLSKEKLTAADYKIIFLLISNTNYKSGLITKGNNHNVDEPWIADSLNLNLKTVERAIKKFNKEGIIYKGMIIDKIQYFFNPYIQYKGAWINKTLYEMFKDTKWAKQAKEEREREAKRREAMEISKMKRHIK